MKIITKILQAYKAGFLLLALFVGDLTLPGRVYAAAEDKLLGRWRILSEEPDMEDYVYLQFEKGNKLIVEQDDGDGNLIVYSTEYRVEDQKVLFTIDDFEEAYTFQFQGGDLSLSYDDNYWEQYSEEKHLKKYPAIARDPESQLLQIEALDLNVEVFGDRAITHALYTIKNNANNEVEAKINIPLPDDALVIGYALDIGDQMIPGVAVPKEKARETFEAIEDRRVDPGLAEITRGNAFSTEIYPVPEKGQRKIRVSYSHTLDKGLTGTLSYSFPYSEYDSRVAYSLTMSADGMRFPPSIKKSPFTRLEWDAANSGQRFYYAEALLADRNRNENLNDLEVRFIPTKGSSAIISRSADQYRYVYAQLDIDDAMLEDLNAPERVSILWDASASAAENHKDKIKVLKSWLTKINKQKVAELNVQLLVFAHAVLREEKFTLIDGKDSGLLDAVENMVYDGASRFDVNEKLVIDFQPTYALLFSDGISTMGSLDPIDVQAPIYSISFSKKKNLPWLYQTAKASGGLYLDALKLNDARVARLIASRIPAIDVRVNGQKQDLQAELWFDAGNSIVATMAARLPESLAKMTEGTLSFSVNGVMLYVVPFEQRAQGEIARYDWLRLKLNTLSGELKRNEQAIRELGMEYSLVTPYTSLLVLEELDDYVQYGIQPPPNFKGSQQYSALREKFLQSEEKPPAQQDIVHFLEKAWQERENWWKNSKKLSLEEVEKLLKEKSIKKPQAVLADAMPARVSAPAESDYGVYVEAEDGTMEQVMVSGARSSHSGENVATTQLLPWSPDKPYLDELKAGDPKNKKSRYQLYLEQKQHFSSQATYYMDVAHFFYQQNERELALRILTNVLEDFPENVALERMVAYNLLQFNALDDAIGVLEHIKELNAWEPASFRDLANAWDKKAQLSGELEHFRKAIDYYFESILGPWELEDPLRVVALMELNHLLASIKKDDLQLPEWKAALLQHFPLDLRIVITWNSRVADIDLWVEEPSGEQVYYSQRHSIAGGYLPFDIVDGFGPEEYLSRYALNGDYQIKVNLYSNDSVELFGPLSVTLDIYTHYGKKNEQRQTTTVQLKDEGEAISIGKVTWQ